MSLIDGQGRVIISSSPALRRTNISDSPLVSDYLRNPQRLTLTYNHTARSGGREVLGSMAPVGTQGWSVLMERSAAEAYAPVQSEPAAHPGSHGSRCVGLPRHRVSAEPTPDHPAPGARRQPHPRSPRAISRYARRFAGEDELAQLGNNFNDMAGNIEALVRRLKQALRQNQELFLETIRTLAAAIDAKDPYTRGHSERVSSYSMAIVKPPRPQTGRGLPHPHRGHPPRRRQARHQGRHPQQTRGACPTKSSRSCGSTRPSAPRS